MGSRALDQAAKQMGFRDYATYQAYQAHQQMMRGPALVGVGTQGGQPQPTQAPPVNNAPPENWLQRLMWGLGGGH